MRRSAVEPLLPRSASLRSKGCSARTAFPAARFVATASAKTWHRKHARPVGADRKCGASTCASRSDRRREPALARDENFGRACAFLPSSLRSPYPCMTRGDTLARCKGANRRTDLGSERRRRCLATFRVWRNDKPASGGAPVPKVAHQLATAGRRPAIIGQPSTGGDFSCRRCCTTSCFVNLPMPGAERYRIPRPSLREQ